MKIIQAKIDGNISAKYINFFGGEYSLLQKLKTDGVGSAKLIYESGIIEFDKLYRGVPGEIGYVNFELLKNGLILRLNLNQRFCCLGVRLTEIEEINLVAFRIEIKRRRFGHLKIKIVHKGKLKFVCKDGEMNFDVIVVDFERIVKYFQKSAFIGKFKHSVSTNPPEKDYGHLMDLLDGIV